MAHSYHSCGFPVEFQHSMGFRQNPPELMEEGKVLAENYPGLDAVGLAHPLTTFLADAGSAAASSLARFEG